MMTYLTKGSSTSLIVPAPVGPIYRYPDDYKVYKRGSLLEKRVIYDEMPEKPDNKRVNKNPTPQIVSEVPGVLRNRIATLFVEDGNALVEQHSPEQNVEEKVHRSHEQ